VNMRGGTAGRQRTRRRRASRTLHELLSPVTRHHRNICSGAGHPHHSLTTAIGWRRPAIGFIFNWLRHMT